jgi:histone-lysine N-methyltransferase SETMAR
MYWIDFSRTGIGAVVMLPAGQGLNKDLFASTVLASTIDDRPQSRPEFKVGGTFLHLGNARPHLTTDKNDTFGIKRLPHPPYSPGLALYDFSLFGYLKHCLKGRLFNDDIALEGAVLESLMSTEPDMFVRVFVKWRYRLQQFVNQRGGYL